MAIGLTLTHMVDSKTIIEDSGPLSLDSTNINVYIEIESPHGLENITLAMGNATASSLKAKNGSSATGSVTHTHTRCGLTSTLNRTLLLPATATGDFFNSTLPPVSRSFSFFVWASPNFSADTFPKRTLWACMKFLLMEGAFEQPRIGSKRVRMDSRALGESVMQVSDLA
jgi:hypothetical protein